MPCYDSREDDENRLNYKLAAVLCGILNVNGVQLFDNLDWKEIGVNKSDILEWWSVHQLQDRLRKR